MISCDDSGNRSKASKRRNAGSSVSTFSKGSEGQSFFEIVEDEYGGAEKDLGERNLGDSLNIEFVVKNTGEENLLITEVKPDCSCTAGNYTKDPIKPGETGSIDLFYNVVVPNRPFEKSATVYTNQENGEFKIRFQGYAREAEVSVEDENESSEITQSSRVAAYFPNPSDSQTGSGSKKSEIEGFFNSPPAGIENTSDGLALLLAAAREFDNGNYEEAHSLLKQWEAPEGYAWIKQSLEADIVASLGDWENARNLYDEAIESAPKDRPKIYLSLVLKDYLFHLHLEEKDKAAERKGEILAFSDHHLYYQYSTDQGPKGYSLE